MDPVTILSLISVAGTVGKLLLQSGESLYKAIERTRDVDQSIRALHRETAGLGQTITAIRDALQQPAIKNHQAITQDYSLVWRTLDTSIRDCEDTAKTMKQKFQPAQPARTSFLSQAWRQYKLSVREDEIKDLRSQIHTHGSRLQLSLQMIIVIASIISPDRVIESINPRLDHLIAMVRNQPLPQTLNNDDPIGAQLSQRLNQEFQSAAEVVVTSASTIIGDSRSTVSRLNLYAGRTGSELGTPLDAAHRDRIRGWIPPPDAIEEDALSTSSRLRATSTVFGPDVGSVLSSATGSEHLGKLVSMNDLGVALGGQGKYVEAEQMLRRTVELRRKVSGAENPHTLTSMANLASTLTSQGKYVEAEQMHQQTLELRKKVLGAEDLGTLMSMDGLGVALSGQGKYVEAEQMLRRTVELRRKVSGAENKTTLTSMANLASVLTSQGKYVEAEQMHRQTLELRKKVLGAEDLGTLMSMDGLGVALSGQGKYVEAEQMFRQTVELRRKVSGAEHPHTLTSMANLASTLSSQCNYVEAEQIHRQTLELRKEAL